jgi:D-3-phosphoglycerate dehydrogenase
MKVLLLENIHPDAGAAFASAGFRVERVPFSPARKILAQQLGDVGVLGIRSKTRITPDLLDRAPDLVAVGAFCIGTEHVDLEACNRRGVAVFNAPYSNTRSVVELALGEMILLLRGVFDRSADLHRGIWGKTSEGFHEIRGKKLGILGYGNIGSQLSILAEAMGMEVYYTTSRRNSPWGTRGNAPWRNCCACRTSSPSTWTAGRGTAGSSGGGSSRR